MKRRFWYHKWNILYLTKQHSDIKQIYVKHYQEYDNSIQKLNTHNHVKTISNKNKNDVNAVFIYPNIIFHEN